MRGSGSGGIRGQERAESSVILGRGDAGEEHQGRREKDVVAGRKSSFW